MLARLTSVTRLAVCAGGADRRGVGEGGGRPASVKASLSVAFGQRAPNRAGAREQGRGMGAELQGEGFGWVISAGAWLVGGMCAGRLQGLPPNPQPANAMLPLPAPAVGKASAHEERPRDRSKDERREERRDEPRRRSRSRSRERFDRDRRRDDRCVHGCAFLCLVPLSARCRQRPAGAVGEAHPGGAVLPVQALPFPAG